MMNPLIAGLKTHFSQVQLERLASARVAIAGAGGIGSNVALMLARSGVHNFLIIDDDILEPSNLNRQQYWPEHLGRPKVEALGELLFALNRELHLDLRREHLSSANLPAIVHESPLWVEALDKAETKKMLINSVLPVCDFLVCASGLAGYGGMPLARKRLGKMVVVGDQKTGIDKAPPLAPKVMQAAALMADSVLEHILSDMPGS